MREPDVWESPVILALSVKCPHAGYANRWADAALTPFGVAWSAQWGKRGRGDWSAASWKIRKDLQMIKNWYTKVLGVSDLPCPICRGQLVHYCQPVNVNILHCAACNRSFDPEYVQGFEDGHNSSVSPTPREVETPIHDASQEARCTTDRLCPVHNVWHAAPPHRS